MKCKHKEVYVRSIETTYYNGVMVNEYALGGPHVTANADSWEPGDTLSETVICERCNKVFDNVKVDWD